MRHHWLSILLVLAAVPFGCLVTSPSPSWDDMHAKHSWEVTPVNWDSESLGSPPTSTTINPRVVLKPHRENASIDALYKIWRTPVQEQVASHPHARARPPARILWCAILVHLSDGGSSLKLNGMSASQANDLLYASYHLYRHAETNETIPRAVSYALLAAPHGYTPRNHSGGAAAVPANADSGRPVTVLSSRSDYGAPPSFLRWLYRVCSSPTDLALFMLKYRSDAVDVTYTVVQVNDRRYDPTDSSVEGTIDIQYAAAIAYPTPHIFMFYITSFGSWDTGDLPWLTIYIIRQPNIPQTITTIIFASGDQGAGRRNCKTDYGSGVRFTPSLFSATCHYVPTVDGTTSYIPEVAASLSYQQTVSTTSEISIRKTSLSAPLSRGILDNAMRPSEHPIFLTGDKELAQGKSCSAIWLTPDAKSLAGGSLSRCSTATRLSNGELPLDFLDPWLYDSLTCLNDITSGSNPHCGTDRFPTIAG
ncbi:hypothetical protein BJY52DRAFT_1192364 [Lactarius psammicola]|nr:hypothetical protein BJY52DRAFT_1192364 [Lactarius psammicola]